MGIVISKIAFAFPVGKIAKKQSEGVCFSLKECVFANWTPKIQWHIVKNTLLHISLLFNFSADHTTTERHKHRPLFHQQIEINLGRDSRTIPKRLHGWLQNPISIGTTEWNAPVLLEFDRFVFEHEITGLLPYAEYKVDIFGYAFEGDGPEHTYFAGENL